MRVHALSKTNCCCFKPIDRTQFKLNAASTGNKHPFNVTSLFPFWAIHSADLHLPKVTRAWFLKRIKAHSMTALEGHSRHFKSHQSYRAAAWRRPCNNTASSAVSSSKNMFLFACASERFWVFGGRWHSVSRGCVLLANAMIHGAAVVAMWRQCGGNAAAMWRRCGGDVAAMRRRCGGDVAAMWRRCGGDVAAMWRRCVGDVMAMWWQCGGDVMWWQCGDNAVTLCWQSRDNLVRKTMIACPHMDKAEELRSWKLYPAEKYLHCKFGKPVLLTPNQKAQQIHRHVHSQTLGAPACFQMTCILPGQQQWGWNTH